MLEALLYDQLSEIWTGMDHHYFGKLDAGIPLAQVRAFEDALDSYDKGGPASQAWARASFFLNTCAVKVEFPAVAGSR